MGRDGPGAIPLQCPYPMLRLLLLVVAPLVALAAVFYAQPPGSRVEQPSAVFGGVPLTLEYATTSEARARGLSDRSSVPEGHGMLFVFPEDDRYGFWMKDTLVPLDIFWMDSKGHVVTMAENIAPSSYPDVFYPTVPARYVLETAAGFAGRHGIATGTPLVLQNWPFVTK